MMVEVRVLSMFLGMWHVLTIAMALPYTPPMKRPKSERTARN
jgi:predicted metal-binding membrane protein